MDNVSRIQLIKRQKVIKSDVFCVDKLGILRKEFEKIKNIKNREKKR